VTVELLPPTKKRKGGHPPSLLGRLEPTRLSNQATPPGIHNIFRFILTIRKSLCHFLKTFFPVAYKLSNQKRPNPERQNHYLQSKISNNALP